MHDKQSAYPLNVKKLNQQKHKTNILTKKKEQKSSQA